MTASFEIDVQRFAALNVGPQFEFSEAIAFLVDWADHAVVDELRERSERVARRERVLRQSSAARRTLSRVADATGPLP